jgi:alkylation response protein AidB-like acyl-CoA dehydrogenase
VRFEFTDDQLALRDAVRDFLSKECPPALVRAAWENDTGRAGLWPKLGAMGVLSVMAGEDLGGFGGTELDLVAVLEETGRAALPEPVVEHAAVAVPLIDETGAGSGKRTYTIGLAGSPYVLYADTADFLIVEHQGDLCLVARDDVQLTPVPAVDRSRRLARVEWKPSAASRIGGPGEAARAADRAALGTAAQLLGLAQHLLDVTVEYARARHQFGAPIGSFQAVKHQLADVALGLEFARPVVYRAAYSLAHDKPAGAVHVSMAKAYASDAASRAARTALQVHGAIGYTTEYDLHLWMKRVWALTVAYGDAAWHTERVAAAVLDRDHDSTKEGA